MILLMQYNMLEKTPRFESLFRTMCGIVGYIGEQKACPILLQGLRRLEYRGYDSAGMALLDSKALNVVRRTGRVDNLANVDGLLSATATTGICHTRWATHGGVTEANAHPHVSSDGKFALVHNGVIENHNQIRDYLLTKGYTFQSETDSEAIANLIAYHYAKENGDDRRERFLVAVRKTLSHLEGTYGLAVLCVDCPDTMVGARKGSPLCVGVGNDEYLLASDVSAFVGRTATVVYLEDNQLVQITPDDFSISTTTNESVEAVTSTVDWDFEDSDLGSFSHYMEKEIFEQAVALENATRGRFSDDDSTTKFGSFEPADMRQIDRIVFCACGTAWHACLTAEYLIERFARIPVEVEYASEFRYRNSPLDRNTLFFVISQSGETLDTLEALREAKRKGYRTLAITNSVGSSIAREANAGIYQHAGPEIGVASTKAFTSQVLIAAMVALYLGRIRDLSFGDGRRMVAAFKQLPSLVNKTLALSAQIEAISERYHHYQDFLFLGRQSMFPIALEGALKLKEISYIHAEGYPAAEMKHGPIALVSPECPTVMLAPKDELFPKILANIQEIKARKGKVIVITTDDAEMPANLADELIVIPSAHEAILPILATIPVQLLSYHIARLRGCDVDKPRNLAKSVTVE